VPANRVIPNLQSEFTNEDAQRKQLNLVHQLNDQHMQMVQKDEQLEARIESFELAFRMQTAATDAFDISKESQKHARPMVRLNLVLNCFVPVV
jgi:hypothetical protein